MDTFFSENKSKIEEIIKSNKCTFSKEIKNKYPELFSLISSLSGESISEKIFNYLNPETSRVCVVCGGECSFINFTKGYSKTCSNKCSGIYRKKTATRRCVICNKEFTTRPSYNKATCSAECLLRLKSSPEFKAKVVNSNKDTCIKKYGASSWLLTDYGKAKVREGNLLAWCDVEKKRSRIERSNNTKNKLYGNANNYKKISATKLAKYGDSYYSNRDKWKNTMLSRYGCLQAPNATVALQNLLVSGDIGIGSKKYIRSMLSKYGVDNPMKISEIRDKMRSKIRKDLIKLIYKKCAENNYTPIFNLNEYTTQKGPHGKFIYYKMKCNICGTTFDAAFANGIVTKCPTCFPKLGGQSASENELFEFISTILPNELIEKNTRKVIPPFELDIYVPTKKIAIEYNGIVWHSEEFGKKEPNYHINKTTMCSAVGIKLIHIFESEWLLHKDIVKSRIRNLLGVGQTKIFARKCTIEEISSTDSKEFLEVNHLQGNVPASIKLGLFFNGELSSVMTFGKMRIATGESSSSGCYELYRFASKIDTNVIGGASKLLSFFIKKYSPKKITTYANIRYSGFSPFYESIGFVKKGVTPPSYWVFNKSQPLKLWHRFSFRKSVLNEKLSIFDASKTEWENLKNNNYDRIWDCGNIRYELVLK